MMLVQVSVTKGEVGLETVGTLYLRNLGDMSKGMSRYEWSVRWFDLDGQAQEQTGFVWHYPDDGMWKLIERILGKL